MKDIYWILDDLIGFYGLGFQTICITPLSLEFIFALSMTKHQNVCRRRTLSFADITDFRKSNRVNLNENHEADLPKSFVSTMVRRPSFTFYEDYQNSSHELARLTLANESNSQFKNGCEPSELNVLLKSNSQPVFDLFISGVSSTEPDSSNDALGAMQLSKIYNGSLSSTYWPKSKCMEYLSPSSLLSSTLVKLYLSRIPLNSSSDIGNNNLNSKTGKVYLHSDTCRNLTGLLGCLQIASHSLASMVMPMRHSIKINSTIGKFQPSNLSKFSSLNENVKIYPSKSDPSDKDMYTDVNYASCTDSSNILDDMSNGYYSDNYLIEAAKASTKCGINDRWLNMKFNHSSSRFPVLKDGHTKPTTAYRSHVNHHHHHHSTRHHKFVLTSMYAGLKNNKISDSSMIPFNSSQSLYNHEICPKSNTIPSNNDQSDIISVSEDTLSYSALERFCNLWTNRHSQTAEDKFYYMDEKSLERRVRAQASNIISPVSF
ncbi:hypothetical protein MN116_006267 [Schistosoma mekongi]|uniref:Uncharacterized protein n=1 Tax=Schistosoma mekongi TaxID=38744 RepID=A0AAE2D4C6_SCHME|nr:hypothetical protein MN116_006267 [Schistosoma mekongi]